MSGAFHSGNLVGHFHYPIFTHGLKNIRPERNKGGFGVVFVIGTCQQIITICVGQFEDTEGSKGCEEGTYESILLDGECEKNVTNDRRKGPDILGEVKPIERHRGGNQDAGCGECFQ